MSSTVILQEIVLCSYHIKPAQDLLVGTLLQAQAFVYARRFTVHVHLIGHGEQVGM